MKIKVSSINTAFESLIKDPVQIVLLDANIFIPPDKRNLGAKDRVLFQVYEKIWLSPLFLSFPNLSIHEAVDQEILKESLDVRAFIDGKIANVDYKMQVFKDTDLDANAQTVRNTFEEKIYPNTKYNPDLDNADDRGEVKTLAHIGAKGYLYFASNDQNALRLVDEADHLETGLDTVGAIHIYELLYYFNKKKVIDKDSLRILYRYMYHLTKQEQKDNPPWGEFIAIMDSYYSDLFD